MAFSYANWDKLSAAGNEGVRELYSYVDTTATLASLVASAFFNEVDSVLDVGDIIYLRGSDGNQQVVVTAVSPNVTVTTNVIDAGSVTNASIAANANIDYSKLNTSDVLLHKVVTITPDQFIAAVNNPFILVDAAGANTVHVLERVAINMPYSGNAFTGGGTVQVQYTISAFPGVPASTTVANTTFTGSVSKVTVLPSVAFSVSRTAIANEPLCLAVDTTPFAAGNSTLFVHVWYRTISL